jgi:hypothetical protein
MFFNLREGRMNQCFQQTPEFSAPPLLMVDATSLSGAMRRMLSNSASSMKLTASWLKPVLRSRTEMDRSGMATLPGFVPVNAMATEYMDRGYQNKVRALTLQNF